MRLSLSSRLNHPRLAASLLLALFAAFSATGTPSYAQTKDKGGQVAPTNSGTGQRANASGASDCTISFSDVQTTDYFYDGLRYLYCGGAVSGYSDNTFRPGSNATRGQISKMIVLAEGWPILNPAQPSFSDVPSGSTYYTYVETARAQGIIGGYADDTFRLNENVSRGQLSKIVALSQNWSLTNPSSPTFNDVAPGSAFYAYIETASARGILGGYSDGSFRPGNLATRGQICKVLYYAITGATPPPTATPPPPTATPTPTGLQLTPQEQQTVDLINARRTGLGLGRLRIDAALTSAARRQSNDIGPQRLCQHNGTDGSSPWDRIAQAGYSGFGSGEVVGCGYSTAQGVVDGWWSSPTHLAILTGAAINDIGCGWWVGADGSGWQTCDVGTSTR